MDRHELQVLHYITPICNVSSILQHGILSNAGAARLQHQSVAMQQVQDRRAKVTVPGGRRLHEYANLYICGRNPMLFARRSEAVCVLGVATDVLDLPGVVITDSNAGSNYVRFAAAPLGLKYVDRGQTFAEDWRHPNQIEYWRRKAAKCAEVLVPDRVEPRHVRGIFVSCNEARAQVEALNTGLPVTVDGHLFFV
jgi:hypothetical protein